MSTQNNIEIKSSLLNDPDFVFVKRTLIKAAKQDNKVKERVKIIEYIDTTAGSNNDNFFYEMLEFVRFLNPSDDSIAYTTPDHRIFLNAPGKVGDSLRVWDFIYSHECLHQLWDTFEVGKTIEREGIEYNHKLLNIASDCVINEFLQNTCKKTPYTKGIFPETIEKEFGIVYNPKRDTQYTLYIKLLQVYEEQRKKMEEFFKKHPELEDQQEQGQVQSQEGQGKQSQSNQSNQQGQGQQGQSQQAQSNQSKQQGQQGQTGGGNSNSKSDNDNEKSDGKTNTSNGSESSDLTAKDAEQAAKEAQNAADEAQKSADKAKQKAKDEPSKENTEAAKNAQNAADKAQKAADKAKDAAEKAKDAAENGDKKGESKNTADAKKAANEAKNAANEAAENAGEKTSDDSSNKAPGDTPAGSVYDVEGELEVYEDVEKTKQYAEKILAKYGDTIVGNIGEYVKKCVASKKCKKEGIGVKVQRGAAWNQQMNTIINTYVRQKVNKKKREMEETYHRIRRGSGVVKMGQPIQPGKKIKESTLIIDFAFYIDISGSMGVSYGDDKTCLTKAFDAMYMICEEITKHYKAEKVVRGIDFKIFGFDDYLVPIKYGNRVSDRGGTMPFDDLTKHIVNETKEVMINIVITDAGFSSINEKKLIDRVNELSGVMIFIPNTRSEQIKRLSEGTLKNKLYYVQADQAFTLE